MENINHALYQFLGVILFLTAVTMLFYADGQVNQSIHYQIEKLHRQKALAQK
jgi:hypothetical protein